MLTTEADLPTHAETSSCTTSLAGRAGVLALGQNVRQLANSSRPSGFLSSEAPALPEKFASWRTSAAPTQNQTTHPTYTPKRESIALPEAWCRKHLTPAEQRVVALVAVGLSSKEVAVRLSRSPCTVRNQLSAALRKLGLRSRCELIVALHTWPLSKSAPEPEPDSSAYAI